MKTIKFENETLPDWLSDLLYQRSSKPDCNTVFKLLIDDYIKRNGPKEDLLKLANKFSDDYIAFNPDEISTSTEESYMRELLKNTYLAGSRSQTYESEVMSDNIDSIISELDEICAHYITDHPGVWPMLELPIELYSRLNAYYLPKVRTSHSFKEHKLSSFSFKISGVVNVKSYDGMFPRIRPEK